LSWKAREPKKLGKGKETVQKELTLPYVDMPNCYSNISIKEFAWKICEALIDSFLEFKDDKPIDRVTLYGNF
jgi:hypothetical protein